MGGGVSAQLMPLPTLPEGAGPKLTLPGARTGHLLGILQDPSQSDRGPPGGWGVALVQTERAQAFPTV